MPASLQAAENADNGALMIFADEYADSCLLYTSKCIGWTKREDLNYYDFTLNEENITAFNK